MFLMVAEVWHFSRVAQYFPDQPFWQLLAHHQSHVEWIGCSLHDLIQPSFSFLVGVALPFSIASRLQRGQTFSMMNWHAILRAFILIVLGIFLRSLGHSQTNFTFEDTLTQIGLGYWFLFLLGFARMSVIVLVLILLLSGYWLAFAYYPLPPEGFDYTQVGVPNDWPHLLSGFLAHWNKNTNLAAAFDQWFLNLFPRETPFVYNGGGYVTLSFIPTLGTMILGLIAGRILKMDSSYLKKIGWLIFVGALCIVSGILLQQYLLCPIVKRIWTPAWALYSGGWCLGILAFSYAIIDAMNLKAWTFPLVVIGMNSIAIYCMAWLMEDFVIESFKIHLGQNIFLLAGEPYETLLSGSAVIVTFWLILHWMYKNKIFIRI